MHKNILAAVLALGTLSACGGGAGLHDFRSNSAGPDAFSILPNRDLQTPPDLTTLPQPTPGGVNRSDPNAVGDAIVALGGGAAAGGSNAALLQAAGRFGNQPDIRAELAASDANFRKLRGRLATGRGSSKYFRTYAGMSLDAYAELLRFQTAGVATPTAPPAPK